MCIYGLEIIFMFIVIFYDEVEKEFMVLFVVICVKMVRLFMKLEVNFCQLCELDIKLFGNGFFEICIMGVDIVCGIWVYQSGECIFLFWIFIKKLLKMFLVEIDQVFCRLEEMQNEI